jgi:ABC-type transporter Mla maintaining outer membrane lipid asymmetry ATPase subunit MlaF
MTAARKVAQRIVMLHEGRLIADGTPDQISRLNDPNVACFVRGLPEEHELAAIASGQSNPPGK